MKLSDILYEGKWLRARELGLPTNLPRKNPTREDIQKEAYELAQIAKEIQNTEKPWSDEKWRKMSEAIERIEAMVERDKK